MFTIDQHIISLGSTTTITNPIGSYSNNIVAVEIHNVSYYPLQVSGVNNTDQIIPPFTAYLISCKTGSANLSLTPQPINETVPTNSPSYVVGNWYTNADTLPKGLPIPISVTTTNGDVLVINSWAGYSSSEGYLLTENSTKYPKMDIPFLTTLLNNGGYIGTFGQGLSVTINSAGGQRFVNQEVLADGTTVPLFPTQLFFQISFQQYISPQVVQWFGANTTVQIEIVLPQTVTLTGTPTLFFSKTYTFSEIISFSEGGQGNVYYQGIQINDVVGIEYPQQLGPQNFEFIVTFNNMTIASQSMELNVSLTVLQGYQSSDPNTASIATNTAAINTTLQTTNNDLAAIETSTSSTANSLMNITSGSTLNTQSNKISFMETINYVTTNQQTFVTITYNPIPSAGFPTGEEFASFSLGGYIFLNGNFGTCTLGFSITGNTTGYQYVIGTPYQTSQINSTGAFYLPVEVFPLYFNETLKIEIYIFAGSPFTGNTITGFIGGSFLDDLATDPSVTNSLATTNTYLSTMQSDLNTLKSYIATTDYVSLESMLIGSLGGTTQNGGEQTLSNIAANTFTQIWSSQILGASNGFLITNISINMSVTVGTLVQLYVDTTNGPALFYQEISNNATNNTPYIINLQNLKFYYSSTYTRLYIQANNTIYSITTNVLGATA